MAHDHDVPGLHKKRADDRTLIKLEDYCFAYEDQPVLRHVDLEIGAGEAVVLMGDNGSGKSTLLRAICGLVFPARGRYLFDGQVVDERSMRDQRFAKRLHARIGFLFQDASAQLFCSSVADEIAFGPRQMGLAAHEVKRRVDDACALLDIVHLRHRAPYTLSGGEQRRVAIASVLSMNPDVYCFDEPLSGLDARTRSWLVGFLGQLKAAGKTLLVATHDQSLADEVADWFVYVGEAHGYPDRPHVHINM